MQKYFGVVVDTVLKIEIAANKPHFGTENRNFVVYLVFEQDAHNCVVKERNGYFLFIKHFCSKTKYITKILHDNWSILI